MTGPDNGEDGRPIRVEITQVATGEMRVHESTGWWENGRFEPYIWSEGNFSCDCNRRLFFERAAAGDDWDGPAPCGSSAFTVRVMDMDGTVLYEDG